MVNAPVSGARITSFELEISGFESQVRRLYVSQILALA